LFGIVAVEGFCVSICLSHFLAIDDSAGVSGFASARRTPHNQRMPLSASAWDAFGKGITATHNHITHFRASGLFWISSTVIAILLSTFLRETGSGFPRHPS